MSGTTPLLGNIRRNPLPWVAAIGAWIMWRLVKLLSAQATWWHGEDAGYSVTRFKS